MATNLYEAASRPRHLRFIYFLDIKVDCQELRTIIFRNIYRWGGRYNPIIPVKDNIIEDAYLELIKHYDPDYICCSNNVSIEFIKSLNYFNPVQYSYLNEVTYGVNSHALLSDFDSRKTIIKCANLTPNHKLGNFYRLNYGFDMLPYGLGDEYTKDFPRINFIDNKEPNKVIYENKPINLSLLSAKNINTTILRHENYLGQKVFSIVVANDENSKDDLLLFWNKRLYDCKNVLFITIEELKILAEDIYFGYVLYDMSEEPTIYINSLTISESEIEASVIPLFQKIAFNRIFKYEKIESFPLKIFDANGINLHNIKESINTQTIISENGRFNIQPLSFNTKRDYHAQRWALDVQLNKLGTDFAQTRTPILYPFTVNTRNLYGRALGRINLYRESTIIIDSQENLNFINVKLLSIQNIARQITNRPVINGTPIQSKIRNISLNDDSNKLAAFFKLFNNDFGLIEEYFSDKFWVTLFENLSNNNKVAGDAISFQEIYESCLAALEEDNIKLNDGTPYHSKENLEKGLTYTINELCDYKIFLKGYKIKCRLCSSSYWYHVNEVGEIVNCKGCRSNFNLPIELRFSYKLNDLIKNNIYKPDKQRDGNLTVIKTLVGIANGNRRKAFEYSPQLNLYNDSSSSKPFTDLDIFCISEGKLIIGEAKHSSEGFDAKDLENLVNISQIIRPDEVILSCYIDRYGKLEKAKTGLNHLFKKMGYIPKITVKTLHSPEYNFTALKYFYD